MDNILAKILGQHIPAASDQLPDAATAPDQLHYAEYTLPDGRRVRFTFKRFHHRFHKTTRYFWTAEPGGANWSTTRCPNVTSTS